MKSPPFTITGIRSLSLRDVELILAERGIVVSYENGATLVQEVRREFRRSAAAPPAATREQAASGRGLYPDRGRTLWRAVDQDGVVPDIPVQARRDAEAAKRFFKRLLKGLDYVPRVIVTDKLRSYGV